MKKNSDKSHSSIGMFPHRFGRFLPLVDRRPSAKLILLDFSSSRVVTVSIPFPEVRNRKGAESGLQNFTSSQNRDLIDVIRKDKKIEYEKKVLNTLGLLSLWQ